MLMRGIGSTPGHVSIIHRVKALLVTGLLWAALSAPFGAISFLFARLYFEGAPDSFSDVARVIFDGASGWAWRGLKRGIAFGLLLSLVMRGRSVQELSMKRVAMCGALGSAFLSLYPLLTRLSLTPFAADPLRLWIYRGLFSGAIGGLCAAATLAMARRGSPEVDSTHRLGHSKSGQLLGSGFINRFSFGAASRSRRSQPSHRS